MNDTTRHDTPFSRTNEQRLPPWRAEPYTRFKHDQNRNIRHMKAGSEPPGSEPNMGICFQNFNWR